MWYTEARILKKGFERSSNLSKLLKLSALLVAFFTLRLISFFLRSTKLVWDWNGTKIGLQLELYFGPIIAFLVKKLTYGLGLKSSILI